MDHMIPGGGEYQLASLVFINMQRLSRMPHLGSVSPDYHLNNKTLFSLFKQKQKM